MKDVTLDQAQEGNILARDLTSANGLVILSAGSPLTPPILARLKKMGIQTLAIRSTGQGENSEDLQKLKALLDERFAGTDENEYLREIKAIAADHLTKYA